MLLHQRVLHKWMQLYGRVLLMACDNHDIETAEHSHEGEDCGSIEPLEKVGAVDVILAKLSMY